MRLGLSQALGLPENKVRVIAPDVGGGFGGKNRLMPEDVAVAAIAMKVGHPVRWIEDRRLQIAELERLLESQRNAFDSEKSRLEQEEKKYLENLEAERKREETVYRQRWTEEGLRAKQALETELRAFQQEKAEKQEALLREILEREQRIKHKEKEWDLLTGELEQFMSGLAETACRLIQGAQSKTSAPDDSSGSNRSVGPDG